jgi:dihydropyrimidine dehydrogenase (NAD+) subunit PreT
VAEYKLRAPDSLREVEMIRGLGVEFETRDVTQQSWRGWSASSMQSFSAWASARCTGWRSKARTLGKGAAAIRAEVGIIDALEFIAGYKTGERSHRGAARGVIGAGNTAIDAACAAKRLGAET